MSPTGGVVLPSQEDPVVERASEGVGGPAGVRVRGTHVVVAVLLFTALAAMVGFLLKEPCRSTAWTGDQVYPHLCYSDVGTLYQLRSGLAGGGSPYAGPADQVLEYPVLTGGFMWGAARVTDLVAGGATAYDRTKVFFGVNVVLLAGLALLTSWLLLAAAGRRPWDAALFALAPGLVLTAFINWDLLAVALTAGALLAWARSRPGLAGVLLGLAVAAKFYPVVLLLPLFLLCLRAGRMRAFARALAGAVVAWLAVNLPVALAWPSGWWQFYRLSRERVESFGSPWYALAREGWYSAGSSINLVSGGTFVLLCVGVGALALLAPRRPRLGQLAFLVVAAFTMTNKVYSPQYVLWLVALFPLARPRWRELLVWQAAEAVYFVAVWWHLQGLTFPAQVVVPEWTHTGATFLRIVALAWVCALIVRDVLAPEQDPIRSDGVDDPLGGVLDGVPDAFPGRARAPVAAGSV